MLDALTFNPFLPEDHEDPYLLSHQLRAEDPVHRGELGFWVLTRHTDVLALLRDPRTSHDPRSPQRVELLQATTDVDDLLAAEEAAARRCCASTRLTTPGCARWLARRSHQ